MIQIDHFEVLNSLRDELINALNRENEDLKEQISKVYRVSEQKPAILSTLSHQRSSISVESG